MHQILRSSRTTLNHHIDAAESYANNMRLYEATGVDDPCEPPAGPDIGVRAVGGSPEDGARKIVEELVVRGSLPEEGRERGLGTA